MPTLLNHGTPHCWELQKQWSEKSRSKNLQCGSSFLDPSGKRSRTWTFLHKYEPVRTWNILEAPSHHIASLYSLPSFINPKLCHGIFAQLGEPKSSIHHHDSDPSYQQGQHMSRQCRSTIDQPLGAHWTERPVQENIQAIRVRNNQEGGRDV